MGSQLDLDDLTERHPGARADLETLRKDAERYRWLRKMDITHEYGITNGDMSECPTGDDADAAIDAAMSDRPAVGDA